MSDTRPRPPGFWRVTWLLLATARKRAMGRQKRARQMFRQQSSGKAANWSGLGVLLAALLMAGLNIVGAYLVKDAVLAGQRVAAEQRGYVVVGAPFLQQVQEAQFWAADQKAPWAEIDAAMRRSCRAEAGRLVQDYGGSQDMTAARLRDRARPQDQRLHHARARCSWAWGIGHVGRPSGDAWLPRPALVGPDAGHTGRSAGTRRAASPASMWEWLLSHPVRPGAVFCAEMLAPIAASPLFWSAPLVHGFLYGFVYGSALGAFAAIVVGIPATAAGGLPRQGA